MENISFVLWGGFIPSICTYMLVFIKKNKKMTGKPFDDKYIDFVMNIAHASVYVFFAIKFLKI